MRAPIARLHSPGGMTPSYLYARNKRIRFPVKACHFGRGVGKPITQEKHAFLLLREEHKEHTVFRLTRGMLDEGGGIVVA